MSFIRLSPGWTTAIALGLIGAGVIPTAAQDAPTFRSGVELVTVDVSVIAPDGRPDPALGADDFVLKIDGRPRRVVSAQYIRLDSVETAGRALPARHFSSNEFDDAGRLVLVAVDEEHIRRTEGRAALRAAAAFIEGLAPEDRVAVVGLSRVGQVEFTRDRAALLRRLEQLIGHADPVFLQFNIGLAEAVEVADGSRSRLADLVLRECGRSLTEYVNLGRAADDAVGGRDPCPEQLEQEARAVAQHARTQARISVSALEALAMALKSLDGPKTLVLLSEGLVADPRLVDLAEFSAAAQEARLSIYVLQLEQPLFEAATDRVSPSFMHDARMRGDGLSRLAGAARGAVFRLVGSDPKPFHRIANELAGHYLIAFEPLPEERDGRTHRIELSVTGGRADVRARQAFRLPAAVRSPRAREEDLVSLLRSARPATELPVRVTTYSYVEPVSAQIRVVVSAEAEASAAAGAGVVLGYVLVDSRGVIVASGALRSDTGRHAFTTRVAAGIYTLRVGGIDALGRRGLVARTFTAAVQQQNGVQISDLILAPVPPNSEVPLHPIVDRVDDSQLVAYLELAALAARPLTDLQVRFELIGEDDTTRRPEVSGDVVTSGSLWASARTVLPVDGLPRGRYVVVARVLRADREVARTARPFTIP